MKILIARLNHETNTFSPVPTPLEAFAPTYGEDAYRANKGMRTAMAAFIELAEGLGATLVTDNQREFQRVVGLPLENWLS